MKTLYAIAVMMLVSRSAECQSISRARRELEMANQAVLASLAVSHSPKGRQICSQSELACVGPDRAELGLALIGNSQTKLSHSALVRLLRFQLDGSVAEDYRCYVFQAGTAIKQELLNVKPEVLISSCRTELDKLTRSRKTSFEGLDNNSVCADASGIKVRAKELIDGIAKGAKCAPEDF